MEPIVAFQTLVLTVAAAMAVKAFETTGLSRVFFWAAFGICAVAGIFARSISATWPGTSAAMGALGSSPVTWFLVFVGALIILRKPWASQRTSTEGTASSDKGLEATRIDIRLSELEARHAAVEEKNKAIIQDYQRMLGLESTFDERLARLTDRVEGLKDGLSETIIQSAGQNAGEFESLKGQIQNIYDALGAIYHRERLSYLNLLLEKGADEPAAPTREGSSYNEEQWERWQANERAWRGTLEQWCSLAAAYVPDIEAKVLTTTNEHYQQKGTAEVQQFPDAEAYILYKTFCGLQKNWQNWQEDVRRAVHQAAFNSPGRKPVAGAGYLEELGSRT
jgi:hypothetical protein